MTNGSILRLYRVRPIVNYNQGHLINKILHQITRRKIKIGIFFFSLPDSSSEIKPGVQRRNVNSTNQGWHSRDHKLKLRFHFCETTNSGHYRIDPGGIKKRPPFPPAFGNNFRVLGSGAHARARCAFRELLVQLPHSGKRRSGPPPSPSFGRS